MPKNKPVMFVGDYVIDLVDLYMAGMISGQNVIVIGSAGDGKTAIMRRAAYHMTDDNYVWERLNPSTPVSKLLGLFDPKLMLEKGRFKRVVDDTAYAPGVRAGVFDEIGRVNEAANDALLDVLDPIERPDAPVIFAASNFFSDDNRATALASRFGLWFHLDIGAVDPGLVSDSQLDSMGDPDISAASLPTWDQIIAIRSAQAGPDAKKAIRKIMRDLKQAAINPGVDAGNNAIPPFRPTMRNYTQWTWILFRCGMWYSNMNPNFKTVPDKAVHFLKYSWPVLTPETAITWASVASSVVDTLGAAIEKIMNDVFGTLKEFQALPKEKRTLSALSSVTPEIQKAEESLDMLLGDEDPTQLAELKQLMNNWAATIMKDEKLER